MSGRTAVLVGVLLLVCLAGQPSAQAQEPTTGASVAKRGKAAATPKARAKPKKAAKAKERQPLEKPRVAKPAAAPPASASPGGGGPGETRAPSSGDASALSSEADEAVRKEGDSEIKTVEFGGLDIEGQLKTPQMLYFLNRMRAEFDRPELPHRSFMPELQRGTKEQAF